MKKFIVQVREVHIQRIAIEADDENEAMNLVAADQGTTIDDADSCEYSHTLEREYWSVRPPEKFELKWFEEDDQALP